jgi:quercetin dioxygenase-like cupin family protein
MQHINRLAGKLLGLIVIFYLTPTLAEAPTMQVLSTDNLQWQQAKDLPPGATFAVLSGNPKTSGHFVARLKLPPNYIIPAHSHKINEFDTVISGTYYLGTGTVADANHGIALNTGDFVMIPANSKHYGYTKDGTVLQISADGPWGMVYQTNG